MHAEARSDGTIYTHHLATEPTCWHDTTCGADTDTMTETKQVVVIYGGDLARDVAEQIEAKKPDNVSVDVTLRNASERPKTLLDLDGATVACFVMQTIENEAPTEEVRV